MERILNEDLLSMWVVWIVVYFKPVSKHFRGTNKETSSVGLGSLAGTDRKVGALQYQANC